MSRPDFASWCEVARPTRPQPQTIACPVSRSISRSIRRLPQRSAKWPSTIDSSKVVRVYSTAPTPTRANTIVKIFSPDPNGTTSRNPMVVTVVTDWYAASSGSIPKSM